MNYHEKWHAENPSPPEYKRTLPDVSVNPCMVCLSYAERKYTPTPFLASIDPSLEGVWLCDSCVNIPKLVIKTWGFENWVVHTDKYCGKLLGVMPNRYCSIHKHELKDETFHILSGVIRLRHGTDAEDLDVGILTQGMSFRIAPGVWHSFEGVERAMILEVSTPHLESDSYRFSSSISGYPAIYA